MSKRITTTYIAAMKINNESVSPAIQAMKAAPETANYTRNAYASGDVMGVERRGFDSKS